MVLQLSTVNKDSPSKCSMCAEPAEPLCCSQGTGLPPGKAAAPAHGHNFQAAQTTAPCHLHRPLPPLIPSMAAQAIMEHHPCPLLIVGFADTEALLCAVPSRCSLPTVYECSLPMLFHFWTHLCVHPFPAPPVLCNEGQSSSMLLGRLGIARGPGCSTGRYGSLTNSAQLN